MVMRNTVFHFFLNIVWLPVLTTGVWMVSCKSPEVVPTIALDETTIVAPTLVSVQAVTPDQAEMIVKTALSLRQQPGS